MNITSIIILSFLYLASLIFCCYFSAQIAEMKGRSTSWSALAFFFHILGFIAVCFLPNKKGVSGETNPFMSFFRLFPKMTRKATISIIAVVVLGVVGVGVYNFLQGYAQNKEYEKSLSESKYAKRAQATTLKGTLQTITAGDNVSYVIMGNGNLYRWGFSIMQDKNEKSLIYKNAADVKSCNGSTLILTKDGNLYGVGDNSNGQLYLSGKYFDSPVLLMQNVIKMDIGPTHAAAIKTNNELYTWGKNTYGQLGLGDTKGRSSPNRAMTNAKDVICGDKFTLVVSRMNRLYVCGNNSLGQIGLKNTQSALWLTKVMENVDKAAAGNGFSMVLDKNGNLLTTGINTFGQLGDGSNTLRTTYKSVMADVKEIYAKGFSSFAINKKKELLAWGLNNFGQLGTGAYTDQKKPQKVLNDVKTVVTSGAHTLAITNSNKIYAWGRNNFGQLGKYTSTRTRPDVFVSVQKG